MTQKQWNQAGEGNVHVSDGQEGYWTTMPEGTSAQQALDTYMATADYSSATESFVIRATVGDDVAETTWAVES